MHIAFRIFLSVGLLLVYIPLAVRRDATQIELNGSTNSLKKKFHLLGGLIRGTGFFVIGILAYYPIPLAIGAYWLLTAATFWAWFDDGLNAERGKPKGYVSREPDAAYTDRFLVWASGLFKSEPEVFAPRLKNLLFLASLLTFVFVVSTSYRWTLNNA